MSKVLKGRKMRTFVDFERRAAAWLLACALFMMSSVGPARAQSSDGKAPTPAANASRTSAPVAREAGDTLRLVTEFEVNGLKVLVKRREGSQTVVAGLFLRGGSRNVTAENAGIEALMLDVASEATQNFPREQLRRELARTGTNLSYGINNDYSALTLGSTPRSDGFRAATTTPSQSRSSRSARRPWPSLSATSRPTTSRASSQRRRSRRPTSTRCASPLRYFRTASTSKCASAETSPTRPTPRSTIRARTPATYTSRRLTPIRP